MSAERAQIERHQEQKRLGLARRTATLDECLNASVSEPVASGESPSLSSWRRAVAKGDEARFARRLAWDGLTLEEVRRRLQSGAPEESLQASEWLRCLEEVLLTDYPARAASFAADSEPVGELPYQAFCEPFVQFASRELNRRQEPSQWLAATALQTLSGHLLGELVGQAIDALHDDFDTLRQRRRAAGFETAPSSRELFSAFMLARLQNPEQFFSQYSLLARFMATLTVQWIARVRRLYEHFSADCALLSKAFGWQQQASRIESVEVSDGDRHLGGGRPLILGFDNQERAGLQAALDPPRSQVSRAPRPTRGDGARAGTPRVAHAYQWGFPWLGRVHRAETAVWRKRRRLSTTKKQALCWRSSACSRLTTCMRTMYSQPPDGPVVIDAETLLQPRFLEARHAYDQDALSRTQLLSNLVVDDTGQPYDFGGLAQVGSFVAESAKVFWQGANTDGVQPVLLPSTRRPARNVCRTGDKEQDIQPPEQHESALIEGFERASQFFIERRGELAAELKRFEGCRARVLLRASQDYARVLALLRKRRCQTTGMKASFALEAMLRPWTEQETRPWYWSAGRQERSGLVALDVPFFTVPVCAVGPSATGSFGLEPGSLEQGCSMLGLEAAQAALAGLNGAEIERQVAAIRSLLARRRDVRDQTEERTRRLRADLETSAMSLVAPFLERMGELGGTMPLEKALLPDGVPERVTLSPHLYDGTSGALLVTALLKHLGLIEDATARPFLELASKELCSQVERQSLGLGFCHGIGGVLYALAAAYRLVEFAPLKDALGMRT